MPETATANPGLTFRESFLAAKAEHTPEPVAETPETPVVEETPETPVVAETPETPAVVEPETPALIPDAELTALQTQYAKDPGRLVAELNKVWTQKTQALAESKRSYDAVKDYLPLFQQLEADPETAIRRLAAHFEIPFGAPVVTPEAAPAVAATTAATVDAELAALRTDLGPELEYLADGLAPAIRKMVERLTGMQVEAAVQPLRVAQQQQLDRVSIEETALVMTALETRHPDWKTHEPAMLALAQTLDPKGLTEGEFLDVLYDTVTARAGKATAQQKEDARVADGVKKALAKMQAGAAAGPAARSTPEPRVLTKLPTYPTIREAFAAAKEELRGG